MTAAFLRWVHAFRFPGARPCNCDRCQAKTLEVITNAAFGPWAGKTLNAAGSPSMGYPLASVTSVKARIEGQTNAYRAN